jgi:hypothetical protein
LGGEARFTTRPVRAFRPRLEALEEHIALTTLTITPLNPTDAVGAALLFTATESNGTNGLSTTGTGLNQSTDVTSQVTWSVSNGTGQGTITTAPAMTPGLFIGLKVGTVIVQAVDPQDPTGLLQAQTTVTVASAAPTVVLHASDSSPRAGEIVTFTAMVSAGTLTPTGAVEFLVDGAQQGPTVPLGASGEASFSTSLQVGPHSITAEYVSNTLNFVSGPNSVTQVNVVPADPNLVLVASDSSPRPGETVTFTAHEGAGTLTPIGNILFIVDGTYFRDIPLNNGSASISTAFIGGTHIIIAEDQSHDPNFITGETYSIQITVDSSNPLVTIRGTPNEVWVESIYADLLHRAVDPTAFGTLTDRLEADVPRTTIAAAVTASPEYAEHTFRELFSTLLHDNSPPQAGVVEGTQYLLDPVHTPTELRAVFLSSDAYVAIHRAAGNPGAWVDAVFRDALGRGADEAAQALWAGYLQTHSLFDTALAILTSAEGRTELVSRVYATLLHRPLDNGAAVWVNALLDGVSEQTVVADIASSLEYFRSPGAMALWDVPALQAWVAQMYTDVLGRPVDAARDVWVGQIEGGSSRLDIVEQIVRSDEYRHKAINDVYQQLLHRPADPTGLNLGLSFLGSGGTFEQFKATVMGSPEYYFVRGGGTDGGFVTAVLADALDETPAQVQGELLFYGSQLTPSNHQDLALLILQGSGAAEALVTNDYLALLRRSPDSGALAGRRSELLSGTRDEDVVAEIVASREYYNKFGT